jgi:DNA polymerase-1
MPLLSNLRVYSTVLVDAMNLLSRNFHGISSLSCGGVKTGMMYGTVGAVIRLRHQYPSTKIQFLWEGKNSGRKKVFPLYKSDRVRLGDREEFQDALEITREAVTLLGVESLTHEGLEADDIAEYMAARAKAREDYTAMMSGDWDWWQFSSRYVDVIYKGAVVTYDQIAESLKFPPERYYLYKALCGDKSDCVPGLLRFHTADAEELCRNCDSVPKMIEYLAKQRRFKLLDRLNNEGWQIDRNLKVLTYGKTHFDLSKLQVESQPMDEAGLKGLFEKWEMKKFIKEMHLE